MPHLWAEDAIEERAAAGCVPVAEPGEVGEVVKAWERLRPKLAECWKCGSPHWPDEPCDGSPPKAVKAINKEEVERARRDISDAVPFIMMHGRELEDS